MATRKEIRAAIVAALTPALAAVDTNIKIHAFKKPIHETDDAFVCVYMEQGNVENHVDLYETQAEVALYILKPDQENIDDALDDIGNAAITALAGNIPAQNSMHSAWQYVRDEHPGWTGLRLTFQLFD